MGTGKRKFWGWGVEEADLKPEQVAALGQALAERFKLGPLTARRPPRVDELRLRAPRVRPPKALAGMCSSDPYDRAGHTYGKSFRDVVRALESDFRNPPDLVAFPRSAADVAALLDWCTSERVVAIPYGGGSSVVGGVEMPAEGGSKGAVSIDLQHLNRVLEVDKTSRAAHLEAGMYGPALEAALKPHRLTLRHFPQSFEFSTLGGWIATRSGGHFATLYTHIDDFVEALHVVTPAGPLQTFRVPGSGAGVSPDRMFIGSEGTLGIITSAWMRLQDRPTFRANSSVTFPDFLGAARAVRAICQAGLYPANVRILDPLEALNNGAADGSVAVMVLGFESADHALDAWMARALECCRDHGGNVPRQMPATTEDTEVTRQGAAGAWRDAFIAMPYVRDAWIQLGMIWDTFETAITWERFPTFHSEVTAAVEAALREVCGGGSLSCRFTHAYPDGPAPYYTFTAPAKPGSQIEQWMEIKQAASEIIVRSGATITHHHAVGRDHRPWYDRQRPEPFARAMVAAKQALDPAGVLNPGVLIDPA